MSNKRLVAVVDDDQRVLESLADLLESAGHSVLVFESAHALLQTGRLSDIHCLIADIGMPMVDGFELRRLARAARPELPVILITGRHEMADQQRHLEQGNDAFFHKPFDGREMLEAVANALRDQRGR